MTTTIRQLGDAVYIRKMGAIWHVFVHMHGRNYAGRSFTDEERAIDAASSEGTERGLRVVELDSAADAGAMTTRDLFTVAEAAGQLGLQPGTIRRQIAQGRLTADKRSPRIVLISAREIERYRQEHLGTRKGKTMENTIIGAPHGQAFTVPTFGYIAYERVPAHVQRRYRNADGVVLVRRDGEKFTVAECQDNLLTLFIAQHPGEEWLRVERPESI